MPPRLTGPEEMTESYEVAEITSARNVDAASSVRPATRSVPMPLGWSPAPKVPPIERTVPTVPVPQSVPPELIVIALEGELPSTWNVPAETVVAPEYEPVELRMKTPDPALVNVREPPLSLMPPLRVSCAAVLTVIVALTRSQALAVSARGPFWTLIAFEPVNVVLIWYVDSAEPVKLSPVLSVMADPERL